MKPLSKKTVMKLSGAIVALLWGCGPTGFDPSVEPTTGNGEPSTIVSLLTTAEKRSRSDAVKAISAPRGITNPVVYAGVANHETGMAQCWSEATWACQGPNSSDCGGGPVIAGAGDGPCSYKQGGLGMFQFDAGTHSQTLAAYGSGILTINGNISKGIDTILYKMQVCPNTRDFITSDAAAIAYLNKAKPGTTEFETFLTTMAWCYNGCSPTGCSAHNQRREDYRRGVTELLNLFGEAYWYTPQSPWYNVFILGTDNAIWSRHWNGTAWHAWENLGGVLGTAPTSAKMSADTVHVYAVGTNGVLYQKWWNGSAWSPWESLGGVLHLSRPAAASMGPGDMHVFARGTDNQLYQRWWNGTGWVEWENLGGNLASAPAAVSKEQGTLNLFARSPTGTLIHKYWTGTAWSIWEDLGGQITSAPAVVSISTGTMHIFARGTDNAIWMRRWTGSAYSNWESIGGQAVGDPWAVSPSPGTMHIFTKATDGAVWQKTWTNNAWIDWRSIGGNPK